MTPLLAAPTPRPASVAHETVDDAENRAPLILTTLLAACGLPTALLRIEQPLETPDPFNRETIKRISAQIGTNMWPALLSETPAVRYAVTSSCSLAHPMAAPALLLSLDEWFRTDASLQKAPQRKVVVRSEIGRVLRYDPCTAYCVL